MSETLALDGYWILPTRVEIVLDKAGLDPELQTELLACHQFVNDGQTISAITRIGLDRQRIVGTLLEQGALRVDVTFLPEPPVKRSLLQTTDRRSEHSVSNVERI